MTQPSALIPEMGLSMRQSGLSHDRIHVAHVRHDEGRGLRSERVVGSAGRRKAKKRNSGVRGVRGRSNKSVRPCARRSRPCVDTVSRSRAVRFSFFFSLSPVSAAASIPKRTARDETDVARGRENGERKKKGVEERAREKKIHRGGGSARDANYACHARRESD